jgi:hypothetical protein
LSCTIMTSFSDFPLLPCRGAAGIDGGGCLCLEFKLTQIQDVASAAHSGIFK